jgi:DNA-binding CsgD family transcriptional regulator
VELVEPKLTRRELEILKLVSEGRSNRQVAELLWVTDQTVKFHLANVYRKLGVRSRFDAARWALEHGILDTAAEEAVAHASIENQNGNGNGKTNVISLRRPAAPLVRGRLEGTSR